MHNCLRNMGYTLYFDKSQYALGVMAHLDGYTYHVEIENTEKDFNPEAVDSIIENEKFIFKELGLNPDLADKRPWVEILK